jgi:purine-cytosine permease-like protein
VSEPIDAAGAEPSSQDHTHEAVPSSERRGAVTMGLLWITMVTCFPSILAGFQWRSAGLSFNQVVGGSLISCFLVLLYALPACYLGAKTGLTYTLLSRFVFGRWGARFITINILSISTCWYALNAIFLAEGLRGLFHLQLHELWFAAAIALLMAINNFFGFSGVANFAQFLAAPLLIIWVLLSLYRVVGMGDTVALVQTPHTVSHMEALTVISSFVLGVSCWGNEPDYWRFGKPQKLAPLLPLAVALLLGQVLFPLTGWMMGAVSGANDTASATHFVSQFVFGGAASAFALVLAVSYVAVNDSGLYAAINAAENLKEMPRKLCVAGLAICAAVVTIALFGYTRNFELVAALSSVFLPCATTIMAAEAFLVKRICGKSEDFKIIPKYRDLPAIRWAAAISFLLGATAGILSAGFIPGTAALRFGVPALNGWIVSVGAYLILRPFELKSTESTLCK